MKRKILGLWFLAVALILGACSPERPGPSAIPSGSPGPSAAGSSPEVSFDTAFAKDLQALKSKGYICAVGAGRGPRYDLALDQALLDGQQKVAVLVAGPNPSATLKDVVPLVVPRQRLAGKVVEVGVIVGFRP